MNELIAAMVGRSLDNRFPPVDNTPGDDSFFCTESLDEICTEASEYFV